MIRTAARWTVGRGGASTVETATRARQAIRASWITRRERPWLGLVAVPLEMTATALANMWWTWPVLLLGAWVCLRSWVWSWVLTLELGLVGLVWGYVGASYLAQFPDEPLLVGAVWMAFPGVLVVAGVVNRRRANRPDTTSPPWGSGGLT